MRSYMRSIGYGAYGDFGQATRWDLSQCAGLAPEASRKANETAIAMDAAEQAVKQAGNPVLIREFQTLQQQLDQSAKPSGSVNCPFGTGGPLAEGYRSYISKFQALASRADASASEKKETSYQREQREAREHAMALTAMTGGKGASASAGGGSGASTTQLIVGGLLTMAMLVIILKTLSPPPAPMPISA